MNIRTISEKLYKLAATEASTADIREAMKAPLMELATQKADTDTVETLTQEEMRTIESIVEIGRDLVTLANKTSSINLKLKPILVVVGQALQGI